MLRTCIIMMSPGVTADECVSQLRRGPRPGDRSLRAYDHPGGPFSRASIRGRL
jgi:hypothetical protein